MGTLIVDKDSGKLILFLTQRSNIGIIILDLLGVIQLIHTADITGTVTKHRGRGSFAQVQTINNAGR